MLLSTLVYGVVLSVCNELEMTKREPEFVLELDNNVYGKNAYVSHSFVDL